MTAGRFCIDTNAVVDFLEGEETLVRLIRKGHEELLLSAVVVGELIFGARNSARAAENLERYRRFIRRALHAYRTSRGARLVERWRQSMVDAEVA